MSIPDARAKALTAPKADTPLEAFAGTWKKATYEGDHGKVLGEMGVPWLVYKMVAGAPPNWNIKVDGGVFAITEKGPGKEEKWPMGESDDTQPLKKKPMKCVVKFEGGVVSRVSTCDGATWTQRFYFGADGKLVEETFFHDKGAECLASASV